MNEIVQYYDRLYNVVANDVDTMLQEPDIKARVPAAVLKLIEIMETCQEKIKGQSTNADQDWERLSKAAQDKILAIIEEDLNGQKAKRKD